MDLSRSPSSALAPSPRPRYLRWLDGSLAGLPRPGFVEPLESDLQGLAALGVDGLVTLEETFTVDAGILAEFGIASRFFPIPDMRAPALPAARSLCAEVERLIAGRRKVAYHCRAGYGRTGTMLAAHLIGRGACALDAISRVRALAPRL